MKNMAGVKIWVDGSWQDYTWKNRLRFFFGRLFCDHDWQETGRLSYSSALGLFGHPASPSNTVHHINVNEECRKCKKQRSYWT